MAHVIVDSVSADAPPKVTYTKRYDYDGSNNQIYEGWADNSVASPLTSAAVWAIKKKTYTGSNKTIEQWADGNSQEDNAWDQRASLTYR